MDILKEVSTNVVSYKADGGEPDTGWTLAGKDRVLGVNMSKPEPWFEKGGYKQLKYPTADDPYKGDRDKKNRNCWWTRCFKCNYSTQRKRSPYYIRKNT